MAPYDPGSQDGGPRSNETDGPGAIAHAHHVEHLRALHEEVRALADGIRAPLREIGDRLDRLEGTILATIRELVPREARGATRDEVGQSALAVDHEGNLRAFLEECNSRGLAFDELQPWFNARSADYRVEEISRTSGSWGLARVVCEHQAWVVPVLRKPTIDLPLADYFVIRQYNGVEPLKAQNIVRFPVQQWTQDEWKTVTMGELDGRRS